VGLILNILNDIKLAYNKANIVEKIIYINVLFFLVTVLLTSFTTNWLALPTSLNSFLYKPWTLITYAFIHQRLFHILSNLLVLYYIGNLFLDFHNKKQFVNFYFLGIIVGGIAFLAKYYFSNKIGAPLGGASAAVSTIFVAIATKIPRYALRLRFIGSVELWVLAAIWVGLSILQLGNPDNGSAFAHIAGAGFGFLYAKQLENGNDIGNWFEKLLNYLFNIFKFKKRQPLQTVYKSSKRKKANEVTKTKQRKIDDILDKISKSGYESLSKEEKEFLFRSGKK
jgi:membrane associated rhomboid family serine protease